MRHLHRLGRVATRLPDGRVLRLWSQADDWVSNQVFWRGWQGYEPETTPLFYRLARRAHVTLDVGAHVGFFSLLAGHANAAGRVFAFEPLEKAFRRFLGYRFHLLAPEGPRREEAIAAHPQWLNHLFTVVPPEGS